jgi:hypothetical protein
LQSEETEVAIFAQVAAYDGLSLANSVEVERSAKDRPVKSVISLDILRKLNLSRCARRQPLKRKSGAEKTLEIEYVQV